MSDDAYWLSKTSGGWIVENRRQVIALYPTRGAAMDHLNRLIHPEGGTLWDTASPIPPDMPDMPQSDAFFRRFG
jgi:hypothetical protein